MSRVSIILTTHGEAPYLRQAIGSIISQTFEDWECVIVKDGIFQCNFDIGEALDIDHRFHLLEIKDAPDVSCRFAHTINQGFKICKGEYVTYLCHDDLYLPWRLERMLQTMVCSMNSYEPPPDIVFGWQQLMTEVDNYGIKGNLMCAPSANGGLDWNMRIRKGLPLQPAGTVDHSSVMHRRECFEKAGGWDEAAPARYGDAYFWLRLQNAGYKFHCIPEVLDVHRFNEHSLTWKIDHPQQVASA